MPVAKVTMCAAVLVVASCYAPDPPEGIACAEDKTCPDPLVCAFGLCVAEVPACIPIDDGAGKLTIPKLREPIVVDGDISDWPTCFITVDPTNAGLVRDLGAGGQFTPGRFSIAADADHLYVAAEVTSVLPLGDAPLPAVYLNNAISVYIDGDGTFATAKYDPDAAQIVVDHANREQAFHSGSLITPPDVASAAMTGPSTFTIEMAVDPTSFGLAAFGSHIGFDIGLVGGDGSVMTSELVWYQACSPPMCMCSNGDAAPYCDARELGTATFAP
ncbi:MAG TPA: sugar-binding protein [Kofleriaceae bacterium]|nr:sugar-binding protein [Kofleriaceae bacterium]